jgi:hypothetical protein
MQGDVEQTAVIFRVPDRHPGYRARAIRPPATIRSRPGRSVTSMRPSGKNARLHGRTSPFAIVTTRTSCAVVWSTGVSEARPTPAEI